ncbi:hypothetical protein LshimejAT787_1500570 [Lyophyllum shimeji]|uniref:Uncharacterized protein n=1 Tax=Lyophyllum shimeji TaxID=47721 RepID=A0A9P3PXM1_LYOSH|nr:hypothetical protein LshimejAT787_1500570 [Lyophyllum shimeji]
MYSTPADSRIPPAHPAGPRAHPAGLPPDPCTALFPRRRIPDSRLNVAPRGAAPYYLDIRPLTPTPTSRLSTSASTSRQSNAPSPEVVLTHRRLPTPIFSSPASLDNSSVRAPSAPPKVKHSTHIPDFVEILYEEDAHGDRRKYLLLLVENKKKPIEVNGEPVITAVSFNEVIAQTAQQARHAFSADGNGHIKVIGVMVALGRFWRYAEYRREALITKDTCATFRSKSEETYIPSESEDENPKLEVPSPFFDHPAVHAHYDEDLQCCSLDTPKSDAGLQAVRERMRELAATYYLRVSQ